MEFIWGVLAIAVAIGVFMVWRKGISQGFKFAKNEFDRLIEPMKKIAFLNGRDETLEAYRDEMHFFRAELKLKRSPKVIDKKTDEKMSDLEKMREMVKKEIAETRHKAGLEYMDRMSRSGMGRGGFTDAGLQQIMGSLGLSPEEQARILRENHKPADMQSGLIQSLLSMFTGRR